MSTTKEQSDSFCRMCQPHDPNKEKPEIGDVVLVIFYGEEVSDEPGDEITMAIWNGKMWLDICNEDEYGLPVEMTYPEYVITSWWKLPRPEDVDYECPYKKIAERNGRYDELLEKANDRIAELEEKIVQLELANAINRKIMSSAPNSKLRKL